MPGLLVGDTPVTERGGTPLPMQFLAPRLLHFHRRGQPVDAVGVGVDRIVCSVKGDGCSTNVCLPIRSVDGALRPKPRGPARARTSPRPGSASATRLVVALPPAGGSSRERASDLETIGVDPDRPLIAVNVVNMQWRDRVSAKRAVAAALDFACARLDVQVGFFCNEAGRGSSTIVPVAGSRGPD